MLVTFTDFGVQGPYLGQMKAVLTARAPGVPIVDLLAEAPRYAPWAAAYLLAAFGAEFPLDTVFVGVVDPGVGTATRRPVVVRAGGRWYVGPDNGLFQVVCDRARNVARWEITWRPSGLSATFHGRDLFAPVAATIAAGGNWQALAEPIQGPLPQRWADDLWEIVFIDHYGNAMVGVRGAAVAPVQRLRVAGHVIQGARTFGEVAPGEAFWYVNSSGLVEVAVNRGRADALLGLELGQPIALAE